MSSVSLRRRLLALILGITAVTWLASSAVSYFKARHEAEELLDAHLSQSAALLVAQAGEELDEIDTEHAPTLHRYARKAAFQVWERGTRLRLHSPNAPDERLSEVEEGFSNVTHGKEGWRVFSAWDREGRFLIQVGELRRARESIAGSVAATLLFPLLGALPVLGLAVWLGIGRGLRPLGELRQELSRRDANDLSPLALEQAPREVAPLVAELNHLLDRIRESLERERRLTSDAAHELRTPLAVLSTQAQLARASTSDSVRNEALDGLVAGADRAARLAEQMLTLARLEAGQTGGERHSVELGEIARAVLADEAPRALAKQLDIDLRQKGRVVVEGYSGLLSVLVRNLVDNAVRYTPPGGSVRVFVSSASGRGCLDVSDSGPGVPAEELPRLGERFHRFAESGESGSGLGLSIVKRISDLHGGAVKFSLGKDARGLTVRVELPATQGGEPQAPR